MKYDDNVVKTGIEHFARVLTVRNGPTVHLDREIFTVFLFGYIFGFRSALSG